MYVELTCLLSIPLKMGPHRRSCTYDPLKTPPKLADSAGIFGNLTTLI
jgi:hypothetical protein